MENRLFIQDYVNIIWDERKGYDGIVLDFMESIRNLKNGKDANTHHPITNKLLLNYAYLETLYLEYQSLCRETIKGYDIEFIPFNRANILYKENVLEEEISKNIELSSISAKFILSRYIKLHLTDYEHIKQLDSNRSLWKLRLIIEVDIEDISQEDSELLDKLVELDNKNKNKLAYKVDNILEFKGNMKLSCDRSETVKLYYYLFPKHYNKLKTYPTILLFDHLEDAIAMKDKVNAALGEHEKVGELIVLATHTIEK